MKVNLLITDLDNTLYDWVKMWSDSFTFLLHRLHEATGLEKPTLLNDAKLVFQRHNTSEYLFLVEEMPSLPGRTNPETWREKYERLVTEYMIKRDASLELYPSVIDTLKIIKSSGTNIVAYTESMELYTLHRLRILGLDGLIDRVYTPSNHIYPNHLTTEQEKRVKAAYESARLKKTISCHTPPGELKPNPQLLLRIIDDMKGDLDSTIYIGDNPYKDIAMAQAAQVTDVFARYGSAHNRDTYELLRAVTHWSPSDVDKEKRLHEPGNMNPTHVLESGFKELLSLFSFSGAAA